MNTRLTTVRESCTDHHGCVEILLLHKGIEISGCRLTNVCRKGTMRRTVGLVDVESFFIVEIVDSVWTGVSAVVFIRSQCERGPLGSEV